MKAAISARASPHANRETYSGGHGGETRASSDVRDSEMADIRSLLLTTLLPIERTSFEMLSASKRCEFSVILLHSAAMSDAFLVSVQRIFSMLAVSALSTIPFCTDVRLTEVK